jgi:3-oxoacyl-[acyl-carrier protein] reductase
MEIDIFNIDKKIRETWIKNQDNIKNIDKEISDLENIISNENLSIHVERDILNKIDVLINNAGIIKNSLFHNMSYDDWFKVINTNLHGAYRWAKAVSRPMLSAKNGIIVNISSIAG